jgi:hypothetical protein
MRDTRRNVKRGDEVGAGWTRDAYCCKQRASTENSAPKRSLGFANRGAGVTAWRPT